MRSRRQQCPIWRISKLKLESSSSAPSTFHTSTCPSPTLKLPWWPPNANVRPSGENTTEYTRTSAGLISRVAIPSKTFQMNTSTVGCCISIATVAMTFGHRVKRQEPCEHVVLLPFSEATIVVCQIPDLEMRGCVLLPEPTVRRI
jgi:hypothetical protein